MQPVTILKSGAFCQVQAFLHIMLIMLATKVQKGQWLILGSMCRYDGQTFVKPPEVLTRDRLLGTYEVKPTLARLKTTLLGTGSSLLVSAVLLIGLINSQADADGMVGERHPMHCCSVLCIDRDGAWSKPQTLARTQSLLVRLGSRQQEAWLCNVLALCGLEASC